MIRIETERLMIREVEEQDFAILHTIYTNPSNMQYVSDGRYNWTIEELKEKYHSFNRDYQKGFGIFVVETKDKRSIIGEAGLFNSFNNPQILELGYILDQKEWGKGFGTEISQALINYSFQILKCKKIVARMYADNKASVKISEKNNMVKEETRKNPQQKEYYMYSIKREP